MTYADLPIGSWFRFEQPHDRLGRYGKLTETECVGIGTPFQVTPSASVLVLKNIQKQ